MVERRGKEKNKAIDMCLGEMISTEKTKDLSSIVISH